MAEIPRKHSDLDVPRYKSKRIALRKACYLCGTGIEIPTDKRDREHVIPSTLFKPDSIQDNLLLTACRKHNEEKGHDEELVATYIKASPGIDSPLNMRRFEKIIEAAQKSSYKIIVPAGYKPAPGTGIIEGIKKSIKEIDYYSKGGIYLGKGAKIPLAQNVNRFKTFYENIAKGYYVAATGAFQNWNDYYIKVLFDTVPERPYIPANVWEFALKNSTHLDYWDNEILVCGCVGAAPTGHPFAIWNIMLFENHSAVITFVHKSYNMPKSIQHLL